MQFTLANTKLISHSHRIVQRLVQKLDIEPQIQPFETQNTGKTSLACQNQPQFNELSHFNLSITNDPQLPSLISTKKSNINFTSSFDKQRKVDFCPISFWNSVVFYLHWSNSKRIKNEPKKTAMKGKSPSNRTTRRSPRVSFKNNTTQHKPRQSPSHSNISTPLTDSPQVLYFDKKIGKVFNKNSITSLASKDTVLKEVRDCIVRSDEERSKQLNPYLHSCWQDLHVSGGCVCISGGCVRWWPFQTHWRTHSSRTFMPVIPVAGGWYVWPSTVGGHIWIETFYFGQ